MTDLVGHIVLFIIAGIGIVAAPLIIGRLVRPTLPTPEKDAIYECGEPTIGSSYIQFDLRYYTVALLFIIFDVEVAFFYPWASVYGGAMQLADSRLSTEARTQISEKLLNVTPGTLDASQSITKETALQLGMVSVIDIAVFFAVLLVGFAYVWKRGDLDWIRAYQKPAPVEDAVA
ncbi:MAG: NADH-quinone oxidoreductase subunit A [Planctomycetota bacterium]|nr:MAG: NADH-quinone oxidoreductase subunit A [Planctomycetota bacterium]